MEVPVETARPVRLFRNGSNQAVRIPRDMELPGQDALISREGDAIVIRPAPPRSLLAALSTWTPLDEDFPALVDLPAEPVDL